MRLKSNRNKYSHTGIIIPLEGEKYSIPLFCSANFWNSADGHRFHKKTGLKTGVDQDIALLVIESIEEIVKPEII